jgi:fumarate reductase subunit D
MRTLTIPKPRPSLTSKRRIEPLVWLTFSGGGVTAAMFMPILAFLFALAFPLGWIDPPDYDHLAAVVGHPLTFLVLFGMFVLMLVHAAHRFRYTLYDGLQVKHTVLVGVLCYGAAAAGAFASLHFLGGAT